MEGVQGLCGLGEVQGLCVLGGRDGRGVGIVCAGREGWEGCRDCVCWEGGMGGVQGLCGLGRNIYVRLEF